MKTIQRLSLVSLLAAGGLNAAPLVAAPPPAVRFTAPGTVQVPLRFDHYYTYEQVVEAMKVLHAAYPQFTKLEVVGKSEEGRDLWAMTVNNPATGEPFSKPGVYVDGNIHGNEIQAGEVCLSVMNRLLTGYGNNDQMTQLVDRNVFYVIPVVNVDGRHHFFADGNTSSGNRTMRVPKDDDRDGRMDEDPPEDLDGDGNICMMRKRDPFGQWKTDPEEPRLVVRIKPGEKGEWTLLGDEGLDRDGDGRVGEDGPGYLDGNRNWGINWMPPYIESGAGEYPFQAKIPRAIAKYLTDRPNILLVFAFHNNGGMWLRGPSSKTAMPMNPRDISVYDILGKEAEKITPGYRYMISWKDLYTTYGDFTDFTDNVLGSYGLVGELFQSSSQTYKKQDSKPVPPRGAMGDSDDDMFGSSNATERERLQFNDHVVQGELFKAWTPFKHPQFGEVEIGGWVKMSSRLSHPFMLNDLVFRNSSAVFFAASQTPSLKLDVVSAERVKESLHKVRVRLVNSGAIPTMTFGAVANRIHPMDTLTLAGQGLKVIAGGSVAGVPIEQVAFKEKRPEVQFLQVPGNGKVEYEFLVNGTGELKINYRSQKAGSLEQKVILK